MSWLRVAPVAAGIACVVAIGVACGGERNVKRADLPAAVERTVAAESVGAVIRGMSRESEDDGGVYYEVELVVNDHTKDILIDTSGVIVEVEEEVTLEALPAAVREELRTKAGRGKIVRIESLVKNGELSGYEARVKSGLRTREIEIVVNGR